MLGRLFRWLFGVAEMPDPEGTVWYGEYRIEPNPFAYPTGHRFMFSHKDYDGPGDIRHGTATTVDHAKYEIDQIKALLDES